VIVLVAACAAGLSTACGGGPANNATRTPTPTATLTPQEVPPSSIVSTATPAKTVPTKKVVTPAPPPRSGPPAQPVRIRKGQTSPGARLRFGQKAIVPFRHYDSFEKTYSEGVLGITPQPFRRTPATNLVGNYDAASRARMKGRTAYYSRIVITNEGGTDLSGVVVPSFLGLTRSGGDPALQLLGGDIASCPENPGAPESFDHKGATWVVCHFEVSTSSRPVRVLAYDEQPYGTEEQVFDDDPPPRFNQYYGLGDITWR
jgi:hypothetical protein